MEKKKKILLIIAIVIVVISIVGGTLAAWDWFSSGNTGVNFSVKEGFECSADGGEDINNSNIVLAPADCMNVSNAIQRKIVISPQVHTYGLAVNVDLQLKINEISPELSSSENFKYALTTSSNSCTDNVVASGTFSGRAANDVVTLLNDEVYDSLVKSFFTQVYYLYIWIDGNESNTDLLDQSFDMELIGQCDQYLSTSYAEPILNGAEPVLDNGMIPVTIADDGTVTTISRYSSDWYSYEDKKWANVIFVNEENRHKYLNTMDVKVESSDILAYYVWIPRFKYEIWTTSTSSAGKEQIINIVFEGKNTAMSNATTIGSYKTPSAFWWDNNSNKVVDSNETLAGFWVGKFEVSLDKNSSCYSNQSFDSCDNTDYDPLIIPNVKAWRMQSVANQFASSRSMSALGNSYGINNSTTNSHVIKSSEWGAVAFLSQSTYGIHNDIRLNNYNSNGTMTGCGAASSTSATSSSCSIPYGSGVSSYPQSTTGNITGVFDMSGGAWEYVMGNYNGNLGSSGFDQLPDSKYYDTYTTFSCGISGCGGHAIFETKNWYSDYSAFITSSAPWMRRGGGYSDKEKAGIFQILTGASTSTTYKASWHASLVNGFGD